VRGIQQLPDPTRAGAPHLDGVEHALILRDDVADATERDVVHEPCARQIVDREIAQGRHAHDRRALLATRGARGSRPSSARG
jgi:hypothetical protein